jgi:hypothetical protein
MYPTSTTQPPWREDAVVIRTTGKIRDEVFAGLLWKAVEWVVANRESGSTLTIAMPERRSAPYRYGEADFGALFGNLERPRSTIGFARSA